MLLPASVALALAWVERPELPETPLKFPDPIEAGSSNLPEIGFHSPDRFADPSLWLESRIVRIAGPGAINCGRLGVAAPELDMQIAVLCATNATRRRIPFSLWRQYAGIDSYLAEGLVGDGAAIIKFNYDGFGDNFASQRCRKPELVERFNDTAFGCG